MNKKEQLKLLRKGPREWNEWRRNNPSVPIELQEANLREANLREANLREAKLIEADLTGADLTGAVLIEADLSSAFLKGAFLSEANLREADLSGTYLLKTDLTGADLTRAILSGTFLEGAFLSKADLTGADLSNATFRGCHTLDQAIGLAEINSGGVSPYTLDVLTLRTCAVRLPDHFLLGAGYTTKDIPYLRAMSGGEEVPSDDPNTLTFRFTFPEGVKTQCEQYLLHFRRFLMTLGVQVRTEITESSTGVVFFSVILEGQRIERDQIENVLMVYISLPEMSSLHVSPSSDVTLDLQNREHLRQVQHLKVELDHNLDVFSSEVQRMRSLEAGTAPHPVTIDGATLRKSYQPEPKPEKPDEVTILRYLTVGRTEITDKVNPNLKFETPLLVDDLSKVMRWLASSCASS